MEHYSTRKKIILQKIAYEMGICYGHILKHLYMLLVYFDIKRVYYIYNASGVRGGHRHKKAIQALICVHGECSVYSNNGEKKECFLLQLVNHLTT